MILRAYYIGREREKGGSLCGEREIVVLLREELRYANDSKGFLQRQAF